MALPQILRGPVGYVLCFALGLIMDTNLLSGEHRGTNLRTVVGSREPAGGWGSSASMMSLASPTPLNSSLPSLPECPVCPACPPPTECPQCAACPTTPPAPPPAVPAALEGDGTHCVARPKTGQNFLSWDRREIATFVKPTYSCPNNCSGKGACAEGACKCEGGFRGADCSYLPSPGPVKTPAGPMFASLLAHSFSQPATLATKFSLLAGVLSNGNLPEGDVVELGVYKGGSAAGLAYTMNSTTVKKIWLYDTFQGHPAGVDDKLNPGSFQRRRPSQLEGIYVGTLDEVRDAFHDVGLDDAWIEERVVFRKGYFNVTMLKEIPDAIALLHIDCDWYECTMDAFHRFYDRIACAGVIILDDYGFLAGQRQAFYDFVSEKNINPLPFTFGRSLAAHFTKYC